MINFSVDMGPEQGISNLTALLATLNFWDPGATPAVGDTVKSHSVTANCMLYAECTVSGTTGSSEPEWPAAGQTVVDGAVTWIIKDLRKPNIQTIPVGVIHQYAGVNAPSGYLLCQGQAISRTAYADLYAVIGTTYGTGDGSTTFNLPNFAAKFPCGTGSGSGALGATGGEANHTLTVAEMPSHPHSASAWTDSQGSHAHSISSADGYGTGTFHNHSAYSGGDNTKSDITNVSTTGSHGHNVGVSVTANGGGGAHNNMPPYLIINYIIKY